jgi:hypothetical protein
MCPSHPSDRFSREFGFDYEVVVFVVAFVLVVFVVEKVVAKVATCYLFPLYRFLSSFFNNNYFGVLF